MGLLEALCLDQLHCESSSIASKPEPQFDGAVIPSV